MPHTSNPVLEIFEGISIRRWNKITLHINSVSYKELIQLAVHTNLSFQKVIAHSGQPCDRCKGMDVIVYDEQGTQFKIKRGLLKVPHQNSGNNITKRKNAKNNSPSTANLKIA